MRIGRSVSGCALQNMTYDLPDFYSKSSPLCKDQWLYLDRSDDRCCDCCHIGQHRLPELLVTNSEKSPIRCSAGFAASTTGAGTLESQQRDLLDCISQYSGGTGAAKRPWCFDDNIRRLLHTGRQFQLGHWLRCDRDRSQWHKPSKRHELHHTDRNSYQRIGGEHTDGLLAQIMLKSRGFALIKSMTVISILAILLVITAPSFSDFLAKKRVAGVLTELATDLQFAHNKAVKRKSNVHVTFGTGWYLIHTVGSTAKSCTQVLDTGSTASFSPNHSLTHLMFDNVRAMASWDGTSEASGSFDINSSIGAWQLRASITPMGRTHTCSHSGSVGGYFSTSC